METPKEATTERSGKGDEKSWVACVVKDISAQWQFSKWGAPRKSAEEKQQEIEMRVWVVGLDAARERPRYGTRFRISPCGMWKARTRSGPSDAQTTKEHTAWSASSTAAIERERDAQCGSVVVLPLSSNSCSGGGRSH